MAQYTISNLTFESEPLDAVVVVSPAAGNATLTRRELKHTSEEAADGILACRKTTSTGIDGQPVVAMALPNGLGFVLAFLGIVAKGAIAAPLNPAYTIPEYEFYLSDSKAGVLVVDAAHADETFPGVVAARNLGIPVCSLAVEHWQTKSPQSSINLLGDGERAANSTMGSSNDDGGGQTTTPPTPDTLALILHTSGTTGKPKAVPLSHENLVRSALNVASAYNLGPDDRGYLIQVLFHIHGIVASLLAPLVSGGSVVVPDKFDANVTWAEFAKLHCSWLSGTPSALQILLHAPKAGPDLGIKFLRSCSSPLLPSTFKALQELFKCPVLEAYAMTENAHQMTTNKPGDAQPGSVGKPSGTVRLQIYGDDSDKGPLAAGSQGEVCITGPSVTKGYLENPEANKKAFFTGADGTRWFRTGDVGIINDEGHLRIVGRKSEIINRGGEKISPPEVDEAMMLCAAPHIREAACFAVPDDFFGQEVEAAIVLVGDAPDELRDEAELQRLLGERLALFKIPKRIHFFDDKIPKGPTGKIQRGQLAKKLAKQTDVPATGFSAGADASHLPEAIIRFIAIDLRVDAAVVQPEVTLLELGADSMSLTRLLGDLNRLGCSVAMSHVMLNPTVQQVVDMCVKSYAAGGLRTASKDHKPATGTSEEPDFLAPFSLLQEALEGTNGTVAIDAVLDDVARQMGLQLDQVEDVVPLTPEGKWYIDGAVTNKFGCFDTQISFVTFATKIQSSVDIDRLKWALHESSKVEPFPRTYMVRIYDQWFQAIAKPGHAPLNWHEWSAPSEQAALDRLQSEHTELRYRPGSRASKYVLAEYLDEGQTSRMLCFVDSHALTDNQSRSMLRDNVIKLYLGDATIHDLPQKPLPTAVFVRETHRLDKDMNYAKKAKFWADDEQSHAVKRQPAWIPPPAVGIKGLRTQWTVNRAPYSFVWTGDLKGLTVALGLTAPTLVQVVLPLALAAFEYQGTRTVPRSNCYGFASGSIRASEIPNIHQARGFGIFFSPFRCALSLAEQSLWLHMQHAALKLADLNAYKLLVESADTAKDLNVVFSWRELAAGSPWGDIIEAGPSLMSAEFPWYISLLCVRLGVDSLVMLDGETEPYVQWRAANGFPVRLLDVLQRCLTFLCQRKDDLASLTLDDLLTAVWSEELK